MTKIGRQAPVWGLLLAVLWLLMLAQPAAAQGCSYWVATAPQGKDSNAGTENAPWATLEHASESIPDASCTIWVKSGTYTGPNDLGRELETPTLFKATEPYKVVLQNNGPALKLSGAQNMTFEGFVFQHTGPDASKHLVIVDRSSDAWAENIIFRNNIFRDSYNNDLLKIHNGVRFATVEGNVFYNQGESEQHMDVNSVTDITIQDNIFFNDFEGSGRPNTLLTKHFIIIKDSNEDDDGQIGAERIYVRRNIFMNWEGGEEQFVKVGNDGKPYHEGKDVWVENNLMIGNTNDPVNAAFAVRGAKNVTFANNTVVGNLPSRRYAFAANITEQNPPNEDIFFYNNIWADATGSMGEELSSTPEFANGEPGETLNLQLDNNLYWNNGVALPEGEAVSPTDDAHRVVADPLLDYGHQQIVLPRWNGTTFPSGNGTIREEFERLVAHYGHIPVDSPAAGAANPAYAPAEDILGRPRGAEPSIGAYENSLALRATSDKSHIWLRWTEPQVQSASSLSIRYTHKITTAQLSNTISDLPLETRAYTLTGLMPSTVYTVLLTVENDSGVDLASSNAVVVATTDALNTPPVVEAGVSEIITMPVSVTLHGVVTDDELPDPPGELTTLWRMTQGPAEVNFVDATALDTIVSFSTAGIYVISLQADDGALTARDELTVTVNAPGSSEPPDNEPPDNEPPTVEVSATAVVTLPVKSTLRGIVSDDGLPSPPGALSALWSQESGPGRVTFDLATAVNTFASFSSPGTYQLRLTVHDGEHSASDDVTVRVAARPEGQPVISPDDLVNTYLPVVVFADAVE